MWIGGVVEALHFDSTFCATVRQLALAETRRSHGMPPRITVLDRFFRNRETCRNPFVDIARGDQLHDLESLGVNDSSPLCSAPWAAAGGATCTGETRHA